MPKRKIDHIVYAVEDLEMAITDLQSKIGVKAVMGGRHQTFGTKNALIKLNDGMYLEILAADDTNRDVLPPRWMGIDRLTKNQFTRWAITSTNLKKDSATLKKMNAEMGEISKGSRKLSNGSMLEWELILPLAVPEVELLPFMIDWRTSEHHPSDQLPHMDCELLELYGMHPHPTNFNNIFESLDYSIRIEQGNTIGLKALLKGPKGIVEL